MASWDVDELESQLLFREENRDEIEAEIRKITGNRTIDFHRLETKADGKVLAKRLTAGDAYEALRWDAAPFTKQYLFDGALEETVEKK